MSATSQGATGALWGAGQATLSIGTAVGSALASFASLAGVLIAMIIIGAAMYPAVKYGDGGIEALERGMRTVVYPFYSETVRPIAELVRDVFNPTVCWFNALNWWGYGMVREVLWPTARDCGLRPLFVTAGTFLKALGRDLFLYIATLRFLSEYADFQTRISPAGIAMFQAWIDFYTCACYDLGDVLRTLPIVNPLPLVIPVTAPLIFFSQQWTDPGTWCAIENTFNAGVAAVQLFIRLATQVLNFLLGNTRPGEVFQRPEVRPVIDRLCPAVDCAVRSSERAYQLLWDRYVPFDFDFTDFFGLIDGLACIALKTAGLASRILIHVDECVTYPDNTYWEATVKPDVIELINLWAAPTAFAPVYVPAGPAPLRYTMKHYYLDPAAETSDLLLPNPMFGKTRITERLCTTVNRILCDPTDVDAPCFAQGAQNLLMGFDFCCIGATVGPTLADTAAALFEFTLHFAKGPDDFFLTLDSQPFTTLLRDDLIAVAHCALSFARLIPHVGTAVRDLLVGLVQFAVSMIDLLLRIIIGLGTLPYFLIALPGIPNYVQSTNRALEYFIEINQVLVADTASSVKNCLCVLINNGFPVPPIPCSSCYVGGFIPPSATKRRHAGLVYNSNGALTLFDAAGKDINSPLAIVRRIWGDEAAPLSAPENSAAYHITPLIQYNGANHTTNPVELFNMLYINVQAMQPGALPFPNMRSVNEFVDAKKRDMMERWNRVKQCGKKEEEARDQLRRNPRVYEYRSKRGDFKCASGPSGAGAGEPIIAPYVAPSTRLNGTRLLTGRDDAPDGASSRSTLAPLEPTLVGCSPEPQCFDLCCLPRNLLVLIVHLASMLGRFVNGLAQGSAGAQSTVQDFPYFTGEFANQGKPTFEADFITLVLLAFRPIKCICQVLNLIIPVTPTQFTLGRPDLCCAIQRFSELLACAFQVLINAVNALAMGNTTHYVYFTGGFFKADVNGLSDISLAFVECLCIFARAVFPASYVTSFADATDFDICCGPSAILRTLVELIRLFFGVVISLATISSDTTTGPLNSFCYWRLDQTSDPTRNCGGTLDEIGVIKQIDVVLNEFFPIHAGTTQNPVSSGALGDCSKTCNMDNGQSGIVPCVCQILYTLVPFRDHPELAVSCSADPATKNCPQLDLCCPLGKIGFLLSDLTKFTTRLVVASWQPWSGGLPEFLIHYIFCSEPLPAACPDMQIQIPNPCDDIINVMIPQCEGIRPVLDSTSTVQHRCGEYTCGKFRVVLEDLVHPFYGLIAKCTCEIFSLLDLLIAMLYNLVSTYIPQAGWSCCFCGGQNEGGTCNARLVSACHPGANFRPGSDPEGGSGILPALSFIIHAISVALTDLMRKFPLPCYWHPVPIQPDGHSKIPTTLRETWIFNFLAPTADALGIATGNLMCIATSTFFLPPLTIRAGERFLGSIIRWVAEIIIRVVAFIEAFVQTLIASSNACVGTKEACEGRQGAGKSTKNVNSKKLGKMLVILMSIPIDILIGDSQIACTTVCPSIYAVPAPHPCDCWNLSPMYGASHGGNIYEWVAETDATGYGTYCKDYSQSSIDNLITQHVGTPFGTNTSGFPYPTRDILDKIIPNTTLPAGCCRLTRAVNSTTVLPFMPICQNPDDSLMPLEDEAGNTIGGSPGYPGSCVVKAACRADALPSIANDPLTPHGLSVNYRGAIDGILMGFTRYLRGLLDHLFTCPKIGMTCEPDLQYGKIFYPLIVIMSISWQILGGVIRFMAAIGIFFFSLFTPPSGTNCGCWEHDEISPYNYTVTQYYRQQLGLCYPCRTCDVECGKSVDIPEQNIVDNPLFTLQYRCNEYCPARQILRNPGMTEADAITACEVDYNNYNKKKLPIGFNTSGAVNEAFNATHICKGEQPYNYILTEQLAPQFNRTANPGRPNTYVWPPCTNSGTGASCTLGLCRPDDQKCLCNPTSSNVGGVGDSGKFIILDFCPYPSCRNIGPGYDVQVDGQTVSAMWPCGGGGGAVFDTQYPAGSLVTCGALQIISSALDVFHAFVEIFTTPIFVPPNQKKRGTEGADAVWERALQGTLRQGPMIGPRRREPRQVFNDRMRKRYDGTTFGTQVPGANAAEVLVAAVYDYDTSDCYSDPVTCHCRNLDLAGHCQVDEWGNVVYGAKRRRSIRNLNGTVTVREEPMVPADITALMSHEHFTGTSVCDNTASSVAGLDWWTDPNVTMSRKNQYVKCLDKMIQGSRMNTVNEVFPTNIMYDSQAPISMVKNVFHGFKERVVRRHAEMQRAHLEPRNAHGGRIESVREEQDRLFPDWGQALHEREQYAYKVLVQELHIPPTHIMFDAIIKIDRIHFKYYTGYYGWSVRTLSRLLSTGDVAMPTTHEAIQEMSDALGDIRRIVWNQPYRQVVSATTEAAAAVYRGLRVVADEGPIQFVKRTYGILHESRREAHKRNAEARMAHWKRAWEQSPLHRWFGSGAEGPRGHNTTSSSSRTPPPPSRFWSIPIVKHLSHIITFQRQHWQKQPFSFWTADLHYYSFRDVLIKRFTTPRWTPSKLRNWEQLRAFGYRMQEHIWPGSVAERWLFNENCVLIDRTVNLTLKVIDYCANEFVENTRSNERSDSYWTTTSPDRAGGFHHHKMRDKWVRRPLSGASGATWSRPQWIGPAPPRPRIDPLSHRVDYREYRAARAPAEVHGPARWNLLYWFVSVVEDLFGFALGSRADSWFDAAQAWLRNPNTDIEDYPNVGLAYALRFEFICHFPQSINCSIGVGLETALFWVTIGFIGVIVLGALFLPLITLPFQLVGYGIAYVLILFAVAFHYPAACAIMTPSFPLPFGFTVPECIVDEVLALLNKWIAQCYVPLVIPSYMVAGELCPTDPTQSINVLNCADIGVSDGIQNVLFAGVWLFGRGFADFVLRIVSVVVGPWAPGVYDYFVITLDSFLDATPTSTQRQRQVFCFWVTLPAVSLPLAIVIIVLVLLSAFVPVLLAIVNASVGVMSIGGGGVGEALDPTAVPEDDEEVVSVYDVQQDQQVQGSWAGMWKRALYGTAAADWTKKTQ